MLHPCPGHGLCCPPRLSPHGLSTRVRPDLPLERCSSTCHEGPVSSRDGPGDQDHPLQARGTHRYELVATNSGNLKRLVELQALTPISWLTAKSREGAEARSKSGKHWRGVERTPLRGQVQAWGGVGWGVQCLAQSFLRGNGTPVSTWQVPVRWLLKIQRADRGKRGRCAILAYGVEWELGAGGNRTERRGVRCGHSRSSESSGVPFPSGPLSCEDSAPLPSPANRPVSGSRRHPPSSAAASFLLAGTDLLLCCPSSLPPVQRWRGLHGAMPSGERGESWVHSEKGSPCQCPNPLSWRAVSSLRGQPPSHPFVEEVSGEWGSPGVRVWLPEHSASEHPFLGWLGPFFHPHPREEA